MWEGNHSSLYCKLVALLLARIVVQIVQGVVGWEVVLQTSSITISSVSGANSAIGTGNNHQSCANSAMGPHEMWEENRCCRTKVIEIHFPATGN